MGELSNLISQQQSASLGIGAVISRLYQLEVAATNLLLQSATFDNASWVKTNAVVVADSRTAPNGVVEADTLNDNSGAALGEIRQNVAIANDGVQRVFSVYVLAGTSTQVKVRLLLSGGTAVDQSVDFNPVSGQIIAQIGNPTIEAITVGTDNWFRVQIPATNNNTGNTVAQCIINPASASVGAQGTIFGWGAQLEVGATASSQIPTTTAARARIGGAIPAWLQQVAMSVQVFAANGTYTPPPNLAFALVIVQASGGGGGDSNNGTQSGGPAGGGGFAISLLDAATIGASQAVTVGVGGVVAGGAGNSSSFGALLSATGGTGGGFNNASAGPGGIGSNGNIVNGKGGDGIQSGGANFNASGDSFFSGVSGAAAVAGIGAGGGPSTPAGANSKAGGVGRVVVIEFIGRQT